MRKKTSVRDLRKGMHVAELDRPWLGTPFLFQGFEITSEDVLEELRKTCQFVYIETNPESIDDPLNRRRDVLPTSPATRNHSAEPASGDLARVLIEPQVDRCWKDKTSLEEELEQAYEVEIEAKNALVTILEDARLGKSVSTVEAKKVVTEMVESVIRNPDAMIVLAQLKNADEYTVLHSLRVCTLALVFGRHLEMSREELNLLGVGALLHDVGKMKVPLDILNKPGKLTTEEFEIMKSHVPEGVKIVENTHGIHPLSLEVVARHHERYGGSGYIAGLSGDAIKPFGMISAIVDCYDAITSDRVYRPGITTHDTLTKMYEWRSRDFHPGLVEQFIQCMGIYPIGSLVEMNTGAVGVVVTINRERRLQPKVVLVLNRDKHPYAQPKLVDLMKDTHDSKGSKLEISKVLPSGTYGIIPTEYLPVTQLI